MRLILLALLAAPLAAQQPIDSAYSARIKELTPTDPRWKFTTEMVETLPASSTVPTPLKILGYVPGTIGKLRTSPTSTNTSRRSLMRLRERSSTRSE